ncbi:MAG: YfhO family protein, partial [Chloroflexi bacterium]|nr:YfhO family protein [Chloroflexota bacterium]
MSHTAACHLAMDRQAKQPKPTETPSPVADGGEPPPSPSPVADGGGLGWGFRRHDLLAIVALAALTLLFYWRMVGTNQILTSYDTFTYFYPYRAYAANALAQGRLPLWLPDLFLGVPFLANIQTAVFYPLNLLFWVFSTPQALAASVVGHVFLAGAFTYAFARLSVGLGRFGAFLAAVVFMFGGFLAVQAGHVNQLNASAWLPLLLLTFDLAYRRRSLAWGLGAGLVLAMVLLAGHTQEAYMTLVALGLFALWRALTAGPAPRGRWLRLRVAAGLLILVLLVGLGLAAVQLLPTAELSLLSVRGGGMSYREATSFSLDPRLGLVALLPGFSEQPPSSEYVGYVGIVALGLALAAVVRRWREPAVVFFALLAGLGLFLALGRWNPFYYLAYHLVPGFQLFRVPARWLYLYTFGAAMLVGLGVENLSPGPSPARGGASPPSLRGKVVGGLGRVSVNLAKVPNLRKAFLAGAAIVLFCTLAIPFLRWPSPGVIAAWIGLGTATAIVVWLGCTWGQRLTLRDAQGGAYRLILAALVVGELFVASRGLDYNRLVPPEAYTSLRPAIAYLRTDPGLYRLLTMSTALFDPGDLAQMGDLFGGQLPPLAVADYAVAVKNKEVLAPNLALHYGLQSVDGYDGGVLPTQRYAALQSLLLPPGVASPDGRLREFLDAIPDSRLLALLNVKYVLADKVHDVWLDDVYYDLGHTAWVAPTASFRLDDLSPFPTTALGLVSYLEGAASLPSGTVVASLTLTDTAGGVHTFDLRAGQDTAEGPYERAAAPVAHGPARIASAWRGDPQSYNYHTTLNLGTAVIPRQIAVLYAAPLGRLALRGLSLIDRRTGASQALVLNDDLELVHSGDVKLYRLRATLSRAFIVHQVRAVADDAAALAALGDPAFRPGEEAVVDTAASTGPCPLAGAAAGGDGVTIDSYAPERVLIRATLASPGLLVLTDAAYPGWRVFVDGAEQPLVRADLLFRGVYLCAGEHQVEFVYQSSWLVRGAVVSMATLILVA